MTDGIAPSSSSGAVKKGNTKRDQPSDTANSEAHNTARTTTSSTGGRKTATIQEREASISVTTANAAAAANAADAAATQKTLNAAQKLWDKEKKALQEEIGKLQRARKKLERDLITIQTDRDVAKFAATESESEHKNEVEELHREIQVLQDKLRVLHGKLEKVPVLEQNLADLYMEFRELSPEERELRPEELQRRLVAERSVLSTQSALVTVDQLRVALRRMLSTQATSAAALNGRMASSDVEREEALRKADHHYSTLQQAQESHAAHIEKTYQEKERALADSNRIRRELEDRLAAAEEENKRLGSQVSSRDNEIDRQNDCIHRRDEILLAKETRLVRVAQLEQQIARDQHRHRLETSNLRAQSEKQRLQIEKESVVFFKTEKENSALREELKKLQEELHNAKVAVNRTGVMEYKDRAENAERKIKSLTEELNGAKQGLNAFKHQADEQRRRNETMREEYTKLYGAIQREQDKRALEDHQAQYMLSRESAKDDKESLRKTLAEKERECRELQRRLKKLILQQHRDQKYYELEKDIILDELKDVQTKYHEELQGPPPKIVDVDRRQFRAPTPTSQRPGMGKLPAARRPKSAAASLGTSV